MPNESDAQKRRQHDTFENPLLASAGLDRLAHHAESVVITGTSFRAQDRRWLDAGDAVEHAR